LTRLSVHLDRVEEDTAVLIIDGTREYILWPVRYLPEEAREGSILRVEAGVDEAATERGKKRVRSLLDRIDRAQKDRGTR